MNEWKENALCREYGLDVFYPTRAKGFSRAISTCRRCPVITECREANDATEPVDTNRMFGVFAAESPNDRYMRRMVVANVA